MDPAEPDYKALCYYYHKMNEQHKKLYHRYKHLYDELYEVMNTSAKPEAVRVIRWTSPKKKSMKEQND